MRLIRIVAAAKVSNLREAMRCRRARLLGGLAPGLAPGLGLVVVADRAGLAAGRAGLAGPPGLPPGPPGLGGPPGLVAGRAGLAGAAGRAAVASADRGPRSTGLAGGRRSIGGLAGGRLAGIVAGHAGLLRCSVTYAATWPSSADIAQTAARISAASRSAASRMAAAW